MTEERAAELVNSNLMRLAELHGVPHWRISIRFGLEDGDADQGNGFLGTMTCDAREERERACIRINLDAFKDQDDPDQLFLEALSHEMKHIVIAPFEAFTKAIEPFIPKEAWDSICAVRTSAVERCVRNLERFEFCLTHRDVPAVATTEVANSPPVEVNSLANPGGPK